MNWDYMMDPKPIYETDIKERETSGICELHDGLQDPKPAMYKYRREFSFGFEPIWHDACADCLWSEFEIDVDKNLPHGEEECKRAS